MFHIPSCLSAVPRPPAELALYDGDHLVAHVTPAAPDSALLRLDLDGRRFIGRGDMFSPMWRGQVATDWRLIYSKAKTDRTRVLRLLNEIALAWDNFLQAPPSPETVLAVAREVERLRAERNGGAQ